ncbi:MAG: ABC transporter substrate-binding protein, partial [Pseudomonadota bacterium]
MNLETFSVERITRRTLLGATTASLLFVAACGGGAPPAEAPTADAPPAESAPVVIPMEGLEKTDLKFGFIKLTDMAPLAIAYEKGYFEEEGLFVTLEPQANWKVLL